MSGPPSDNTNRSSRGSSSNNPFTNNRYEDYASQNQTAAQSPQIAQLSQASPQQSQLLPKVRSSNPGTRQISANAAPATPRMLRNASNNVLNPSNNNLNDYHINTNFQLQAPASDAQRTPSINSRNLPATDHLTPSAADRLAIPSFSANTKNSAGRQPQQPQSNYSTPPKQQGLSPALVVQSSEPHSQNQTPQRTRSMYSRGSPKHQQPQAPPQQQSQQVNQQQQQQQHLLPQQDERPQIPTDTASQQAAQQAKAAGQFHRKSIGEWDFYKTIGAGSMGKVKLARHRKTGEMCAVKVVPRSEKIWLRAHAEDPPTSDSGELGKRMKDYEKEVARDKRTIREAALDKIMYHPFICRLYELIPMTNHYYMLFEYVSGGQMLDYIVSHGSLKERHARKFARGIASALDYCHSNNIVHRDLKIENIMISKSGEIKIIDFGLSNMFDSKNLLKTFCGSLYFAAPELLSAQPYIGPEVDIWSFGVVLYVLVCGKVPFDDPSVSVLHSKIKQGNVHYPEHLSRSCVSLLQRMLVVNPTKRATLKEIMNHPWMIDESQKPPFNYLPHRRPLSFPLDPGVVKEIAELQLGTEEQVTLDLTEIISSQEYQMACDVWYKSRYNTNWDHSMSHGIPDPTIAYHPLISIYYLVDEMQTRRKAKEQAKQDAKSQLQQTEELRMKQASEQQRQQLASHETMGQNVFANPETPSKTSMDQSATAPVLTFPEAAYTTTHGHGDGHAPGMGKSSAAHSMPKQQESRSQSPKSRQASNIDDTLSSRSKTEHDDEANKTAFNSLLRKLSGKRSKHPAAYQQQQVPISNNDFEHIPSILSNKSPSPLDSETQVQSYQPQMLQPPVDPIVRRVGSMKITSKEKQAIKEQQLKQKLPPLPTKSSQQMQHHQRAVSTSVSGANKKVPPTIVMEEVANTPTPSNRKLHPSARAKSVGHVRKNSLLQNKGTPDTTALQEPYQDEVFFDDVSFQDDDSAKRQEMEKLADASGAQMTEEQLIHQFETAPTGTMPSIEYPRTLFLKGFFSVQTTSTKPLPVIRNNIIVVLSKLGVQFREVKGGFICSHSPSIATTIGTAPNPDVKIETGNDLAKLDDTEDSPIDTEAPATEHQRLAAEEDLAHQRKVSFSSNSSDAKASADHTDDHSYNSSITSSPSYGARQGHRRKFSLGNGLLKKKPEQPGRLNTNTSTSPNVFDTLNMPLTPAPANVLRHRHSHSITSTDSQESLDSLHDDMRGGSDMMISSRIDQVKSPKIAQKSSFSAPASKSKSNRSPLRFEIHLVKVPLVGLFGVQFKKLSGNTWMYKTLAGEILSELNL